MVHALLGAGGKAQAPGLEIAFHDRVEAGLVNGHLAALEHGDLALVDVDAHHVVAGIRQTRARDQAHVAGAEDRNSHA